MSFLNGSSAVINGVAGSGPATNTRDLLIRVRDFLVAPSSGWAVDEKTGISGASDGGDADLIFTSNGEDFDNDGVGDESIVTRLQSGANSDSISPLNVAVAVDLVRLTCAPFYDSSAQVPYNEVGQSPALSELSVDDNGLFNFWCFTDGPRPTYVVLVTEIGGVYRMIVAGRSQRLVFTEIARSSQGVTVVTPGTPEEVIINLDRNRPASWTQGRKILIHSLDENDSTGTQELPVELATLGDPTGLLADQIRLTISRDYATGAILGQDVLPLVTYKNPLGAPDVVSMSYDNGGGVNNLAYSAPNGQLAEYTVAELNGKSLADIFSQQDPDDYQSDQVIVGLFSYDDTASRTFALRHQLPQYGRIAPSPNNPLDELTLPNGDIYLAFTIGTDRVAVGKVN